MKKLSVPKLAGNHFPIPDEILSDYRNSKNILTYYFTVAISSQPKRAINEAKVVLVGQGSVGKTSLANRLLNDPFNEFEEKTQGVSIRAERCCYRR